MALRRTLLEFEVRQSDLGPGEESRDSEGLGIRLKVLLIDDHPLIIDGCQRVFESRRDLVVSAVSSAAAGLEANRTTEPDVLILDISLPDRSGLDIVEPLLRDNPKLRIIVLSMYTDASFVGRALELGVSGYVSKNDDPMFVLTAIDKIVQGETYLGQALAQTFVLDKLSKKLDPLRGLTDREKRILEQLGKGRGLTEVSAAIGLSYKTVANAVTLIKHKLKTPTNAALIKFAVENADR